MYLDKLFELKLIQDFGIRALLSLIVVVGYIGMLGIGVLHADDEMIKNMMTMYTPLVITVIAFYFHSSDIQDQYNH